MSISTDNPLAGVLSTTIRELVEVKLLAAAERDYTHWLQGEVLRARQWTMPDLLRAWFAELDRRDEARRITGVGRRAA
jgi:hypothetical protein